MRVGIVGLGRMGGNLALAAMERGYEVVGFDARSSALPDGLEPAASLDDLVERLPPPRIVLLYVPHGEPTERVCNELGRLLAAEDILIDGGRR